MALDTFRLAGPRAFSVDPWLNYPPLISEEPATLKRDLNWIYGKQTWRSRSLLRSAIFDYVEGFYKPERTQKRLGYRSPADFESAFVA